MQELPLSKVNDFFENQLKQVVGKLQPDLRPLWGLMTPQHAIEHLTRTLRGAADKPPFAVHTPVEKLPKYRLFLFHNLAIVHNYKSPVMDREKPPALVHSDWPAAMDAFWKAWEEFEEFFKNHPGVSTDNAVFGPLTQEEWRRFHFKHFVHHCSQFGVTTSEAHGLVGQPG